MRSTAILLLGALGLASACKLSTDNTSDVVVPTIITTELKDSAAFPANSPVLVRAHITRGGFPVTQAAVTWAIASGHGKLSATTATTDTGGVATVTWTLSDTAGINALAIGSAGVADTLRLVGVIGQPSSLVVVGSNTSTITVGSPLVLQVKVVDRPGNPVARAAVNWTTSGGSLAAATSTSDSNGLAQTSFSATTPGTYQVTASVPNEASVVFTIVAK